MLDLQLRPSLTLNLVLALAHLLSLGLIWVMPFATGPQLGISLLLLASYLFYLRRDGLLAAPGSIVHIRFGHDGKCTYRTRDGAWFEAIVLDSTLSISWLAILNLKTRDQLLARHALAFPDSADAGALRTLRVLLRWKHPDTSRQ